MQHEIPSCHHLWFVVNNKFEHDSNMVLNVICFFALYQTANELNTKFQLPTEKQLQTITL